jgi:hypothetical protein
VCVQVSDDEFYLGLTALGVATTDSQASYFYDSECVRLDKTDGEGLSVHEYVPHHLLLCASLLARCRACF